MPNFTQNRFRHRLRFLLHYPIFGRFKPGDHVYRTVANEMYPKNLRYCKRRWPLRSWRQISRVSLQMSLKAYKRLLFLYCQRQLCPLPPANIWFEVAVKQYEIRPSFAMSDALPPLYWTSSRQGRHLPISNHSHYFT